MLKIRKRIGEIAWWFPRQVFSERTIALMQFDLVRFRTRVKRLGARKVEPKKDKLNIGSGKRPVREWLNVDVVHSDYDLDLASGRLPWKQGVFEAVVGQHIIEHLEIRQELLPLLRELRRVLKPGGTLWLSCPDMEKVCRSYLDCEMEDLLAERLTRWPTYRERELGSLPVRHMINDLFHQGGEHKNLFDFQLLSWALQEAGFVDVQRATEADLLQEHPEFPPRGDGLQSLTVRARAPDGASDTSNRL